MLAKLLTFVKHSQKLQDGFPWTAKWLVGFATSWAIG
jgi:hypothetical protein